MNATNNKIKMNLESIQRDIISIKVSNDEERFSRTILSALTSLGHTCNSLEARIAKLERAERDK